MVKPEVRSSIPRLIGPTSMLPGDRLEMLLAAVAANGNHLRSKVPHP